MYSRKCLKIFYEYFVRIWSTDETGTNVLNVVPERREMG